MLVFYYSCFFIYYVLCLCVRFCIGFGQNSLFLPPDDGVFQVEWSALSILRIKLERWYRMCISIDNEVDYDEK